MKVYRIETVEGWGPWRSDGPTDGADVYDSNKQPKFPTCFAGPAPFSRDHDGPEFTSFVDKVGHVDWVFAFNSIEELEMWFGCPRGRAAISNVGFGVTVYEAEEIEQGVRQVVFNRRRATVEDRLDLVTFDTIHRPARLAA